MKAIIEMLFILIGGALVAFCLFFVVNGYFDCVDSGGVYVRGAFAMECINNEY